MIKKTINKIITGLLILPNLRIGNGTEIPLGVQDDGVLVKSTGGDDPVEVAWENVTDKPDVIASGNTPEEARVAIGAGTSNLVIGTTSTTAKAGNYQPTWTQVSGKPTTFAPSAHTHEITDVNGLQTELNDKQDSSTALQIGTTASTAKAGDYQPTWAQVTGKPTTFAPAAHTHPFTEITGTAVAGQIPTLAISKISGLQGALDGKLDAVEGAAVADAVDETEVVAQFNALLASLRTAGIIAT